MTETSVPPSSSVGVGQQLAAMRQRKNMSIEDISARLRFSTQQLTLLEEGKYDALPDMTFVRAMIRTYARFLESDPAVLITVLESERPDAIPRLMVVQPVSVPSQGIAFFREVREANRRWVVAALILLVLVLIGAWVWYFDDIQVGAPASPAVSRPAAP